MFAQNSLHSGQSDTCAFEFLSPMEALEDPKQLVDIFHVKAHAIVAHEYRCAAVGIA